MEGLLIFYIILYIISGYFHWKAIKVIHSKGGVFENITPTGLDFIATFIPLMNTMWATLNWMGIWSSKCKINFFNKFFKIK